MQGEEGYMLWVNQGTTLTSGQPPRCTDEHCYWVLLLCSVWGRSRGRSTSCLSCALCRLTSREREQQSLYLEHRWFSCTWHFLWSFSTSSDSTQRPVPCCHSKLSLSPKPVLSSSERNTSHFTITLDDTDEAADHNVFSSSLFQWHHISAGILTSLDRGEHSRWASLWVLIARGTAWSSVYTYRQDCLSLAHPLKDRYSSTSWGTRNTVCDKLTQLSPPGKHQRTAQRIKDWRSLWCLHYHSHTSILFQLSSKILDKKRL